MKLLLLFPPMWEAAQPFLSVPSLTAYLRENGHEVVQRDLNVEFQDQVTSPEYINHLIAKKKLDLNRIDANYVLRNILKALPAAKQDLKNDNFYNPEMYFENSMVLKSAFEFVSYLYSPTKLTDKAVTMKYISSNSFHIMTAAQDRSQNPFIDFYEDYFLNDIKDINPGLIGISITSENQIIPGLTLSRLIKIAYPDIPVVIGGFIITNLIESLSKNRHHFKTLFDYLIGGEGEIPLLELVRALETDKDLSKVPSLTYIHKYELKTNHLAAPLPINDLPTPDFDGLPLDKYLTPKLVLPLFTSRTCYYKKCSFCDMFFDNKFQLRSPDKVVKDMAAIKEKYGTKYISFSDLTISAKSCNNLAKKIIETGLDIRWITTARFEKNYSEEVCQTMYESGCRMLLFGMESGSQRILDLMEKGTTVEKSVFVLNNTAKAGIWSHAFIIFGFPSETREELQETIDFVFAKKDILDSLGTSLFSLNVNAPVGKRPENYLVEELYHDSLQDLKLDIKNYRVTGGMAKDDIKTEYDKFHDRLWNELNHPLWMKSSSYTTIMLYIDHYGRENLKYNVSLPAESHFVRELSVN
jgi:anaerobic magnesium-protoporphyrin IX monomethyl ester cyclase